VSLADEALALPLASGVRAGLLRAVEPVLAHVVDSFSYLCIAPVPLLCRKAALTSGERLLVGCMVQISPFVLRILVCPEAAPDAMVEIEQVPGESVPDLCLVVDNAVAAVRQLRGAEPLAPMERLALVLNSDGTTSLVVAPRSPSGPIALGDLARSTVLAEFTDGPVFAN
jgi:hypothetical protein